MIGILVDQGLIHYDDLLEKVLHESVFPKKTWKGQPVNITIMHLLTHTSGIVLETNNTVVLASNSTEGIQKDKHTPYVIITERLVDKTSNVHMLQFDIQAWCSVCLLKLRLPVARCNH